MGPYGSYESDLSASLSSLSAPHLRPRILLMGARRSGKSSIQKVVFQKMAPHETLFLEATTSIRVRDISSSTLLDFQLLDFPGNWDPAMPSTTNNNNANTNAQGGGGAGGSGVDGRRNLPGKISPELIFRADTPTALVFVIDAQDQDDESQFSESIDYFLQMAKTAYKCNPKIAVDVLIHKADGDAYLTDDQKMDCYNEIKKNISDELLDSGLPLRPSFHLTSIYDHTIFEALSKIVQSLIPQLPLLERLLDGLIGACGMEKSFLFDVGSKIYVATDSNPVDMQTYELCSDMIDVVIDVACIYGLKAPLPLEGTVEAGSGSGVDNVNGPQASGSGAGAGSGSVVGSGGDEASGNGSAAASNGGAPTADESKSVEAGDSDKVSPVSQETASSGSTADASRSSPSSVSVGGESSDLIDSMGLPYGSDCASVMKLSNNHILYLREVSPTLSLVCLMRSEAFQGCAGLVEYNFNCFKEAMQKLFKQKEKAKLEAEQKRNQQQSQSQQQQPQQQTSSQSSIANQQQQQQSHVQPRAAQAAASIPQK